MDTKEVITPGYGLPKKKNYLEKYGFVVIGAHHRSEKLYPFFLTVYSVIKNW